jgi:Outer membrane protein beta-barrel family/Carboxypeptidase regulatory-like domain
MLKLLCAGILIVALGLSAKAQTQTVSGSIKDTTEKKTLTNAAVSILRAKDSILIAFSRSDSTGKFSLPVSAPGNYLIMITYPRFADYVEAITVAENKSLDMGNVQLIRKSDLLKEVIVKQKIAAIRYRGDTTEFKADSFHVSADANVEDLLKVLPGLQVNSKGEITAQGQKVEKVLVDGEEFFGDDPTMATQNLNAKSVDKVQVFDKKSDEANITGVDDGKTTKTVNLVLKEDAKKGGFGKVEAGADFHKFYRGKVSANNFKGSKKTGVLINTNRTAENNMSWNEMRDFSTGYSSGVSDDGGLYIMVTGDDDNLRNNEGIPTSVNGAVMYSNKYGERKNSTNANYNFKFFENAGDGLKTTQYLLPDTSYFSNQRRHVEQNRQQHSLRFKNEWNLDSLTTININIRGIQDARQTTSHYLEETLDENRVPVNTGDRTRQNSANENSLNTEFFLRRKLNAKGRLLSASFTDMFRETHQDGYLLNTNNFYKNGLLDSIAKTDQLKKVFGNSNALTGRLTYIEPISKKIAAIIGYNFAISGNVQDNRSYDNHNGKYDSLNRQFSNHFRFNNSTNGASLLFRYSSTKINASLGTGYENLTLREKNLYNDSSFSRNFASFRPTATFRYRAGQSGYFSLNYTGVQRAPSITQIQPVVDNSDPLNVSIGNALLKPAFVHQLFFNVGQYKPLSGMGYSLYGNVTKTDRDFSTRDVIDNKGRRSFQTVNVSGNYNYYTSMNFNFKLKKLAGLGVGLGPTLNGRRNLTFVNGAEAINKSFQVGSYFELYLSKEKKFDANISYRPTYYTSKTSINPSATNYWIHNLSAWNSITFLKTFKFIQNVDANFRQKTSLFTRNVNAVIWDASLEKKLSKKRDITAIFSVNDILNKNIGFERNISTNIITENTFNTVRRYWLLSLRWKFSKNAAIPED